MSGSPLIIQLELIIQELYSTLMSVPYLALWLTHTANSKIFLLAWVTGVATGHDVVHFGAGDP